MNQKEQPKYCATCGRLLQLKTTKTYDRQTGQEHVTAIFLECYTHESWFQEKNVLGQHQWTLDEYY